MDEKMAKLKKQRAADAMKRYAYLLGQTDIFAHFINLKKMKGEDMSAFEAATEGDHKKKSSRGETSRRHRKTEKEEDEEMLQTAEDDDPPFQFEESPPYVTGGKLRDYQLQGLNWLISLHHNGINGILADEMGLGKTLQTISFLGYLKHVEQTDVKHLVIVPKSTLHNWMTEIKRWVPDFRPFLFHGDKDSRPALVKDTLLPGDFEICVTSYEMCLLERSNLKKVSWDIVVVDEAHRIKNEKSSLSQVVREFQCRNRLLLTGTPLQNNLHELWALLNFLLPDIFSSIDDFNEWFTNSGSDQDQVVKQLHKVLNPFLLRRIKSDVEKSLLPKKRTNLYVGMSTMQRKWYQKLLEKDIDAVNGSLGGRKDAGKTRLQNIVMQLRKCCNHPYLFDGAEPGPPYTTDEHIVENSGKMVILDKLLTFLKAKGSRVLLFSQMSRMLDILEDYCVFRGHDYCRIDGNTDHADRIASIDEFNAPGSSKFIFLLTTRAGGLGINLATADIVVMYDNDWNPQVDLQAEDRAHRIGQTKQVVVFRFITENAIEEKVIDRATQKLRLDQLVIQQGRTTNTKQAAASSKEELLSMIQHGAESIFQSLESTIGDEGIEEVLRRGEAKTADLDQKYKNMGLEDAMNFASEGSAYQWEGADFRNQKKGEAFRWIQPAKREKRVGSYAVDDYYRQALRAKPATAKFKTSKVIHINDFQFFLPELVELIEKEAFAKLKAQGYRAQKRVAPEEDDEVLEKERLEEQAKIDNAEPLTEAEQAEKAELLQDSFESWTRKDFTAFIRANEKYGRDNIDAICKEIEGKAPEEVRKYAMVFWSRYKELTDWEKHINIIEKGELRLQNQTKIQECLRERIASHRLPLQQLKFNYGASKGKNFTEEEDRFLLVALERHGYGTEDVYEKIREDIKRSSLFRFDWFLKSRTAVELSRRCSTLISLLQKEEAEEREREEKKRKAEAAPAKQPKGKKKKV
ncbi:SNF2 family N-terminal domain-containing protein [Zopfochytrium polystomum]|nr:SNF2 family N-terminal domain-containing protein [Zopfochytrium polystomum]